MSKEKIANMETGREMEDSTNDRMSVAEGGRGLEELSLEVSRRIIRKRVLESKDKENVANVEEEKRKGEKGAEGRRKGVAGEIANDSIPDEEDGGRDDLRQEEGGEVWDSTNDRMSVAKGGGGLEELRLEVSRRIVRKGANGFFL